MKKYRLEWRWKKIKGDRVKAPMKNLKLSDKEPVEKKCQGKRL